MFPSHFTRRGNALLLTTIILALVVTGMLSLTDQLFGRKKLADLSRVTIRAEETADNIAETLCDRIKENAAWLTSDFASGGASLNQLDNWLTRGFVKDQSDIASVKGIWLNDCVVYWRLEPVTVFDHTITDATGDGAIDGTDVEANGGVNYMTNRSLSVSGNATATSSIVGEKLENSGFLFFDMTVDAFAMSTQSGVDANPLDAATNASSIHAGDRSPVHAQIKKRVLVKNLSLFRYVIFYAAKKATGDLELYGSPDVSVIGPVHTNGAAYIGAAASNDYHVLFGSKQDFDREGKLLDPAPPSSDFPVLKPIPITAVEGLFCIRKIDMYSGVDSTLTGTDLSNALNPYKLQRGTAAGNDAQGSFAYINEGKLEYVNTPMGKVTVMRDGIPTQEDLNLWMPKWSGATLPALSNEGTLGPFCGARDSRAPSGTSAENIPGVPLHGYDKKLVRDGINSGLKTIDIETMLKMEGYRPLEPFALVGPNIPLLMAAGSYSILPSPKVKAAPFATDMMLFQVSGGTVNISPTQTGASPVPAGRPWTTSAFNNTTNPIPGTAIVPPPICGVPYDPATRQGIRVDPQDIFSNLGTYIIASVPNPNALNPPRKAIPSMSPVIGTYIKYPLGLRPDKSPGVGIVILERGSQAGIDQWPSGSFIIHGGMAQGGSANQIVLASTASSMNEMYTRTTNGAQNFNSKISIINGTGKGQSSGVEKYDGASRTATVNNWTVIPDNTSEYVITPGTQRLGQVSWDPPSAFSTSKAANGGAAGGRYYDSNSDEIIDPDIDYNGDGVIDPNVDHGQDNFANGQMTAFLMDYCQWMRSNYVVYFGTNSNSQLVDITDQFFSVPSGATGLDSLLATEDVFKDRREATWRESSANGYATARALNQTGPGVEFDNIRVNALTLNIAAIDNFIRFTPLNRLDPATTSTAMAYERFNGTIYAARTPRYANLGVSPPLGSSTTDFANMFTYRAPGLYDPLAPLGFNQTVTTGQMTALPDQARDTIGAGAALLYPVVGSSTAASVNGYPNHTNVDFGSLDSWACYPLMKRVRIRNADTIDYGKTRAVPGSVNRRNVGLSIYTPNVCYLQGNFNVVPDAAGKFPACALYCDGLVALSNNWNDTVANGGPSGAQFSGVATHTVHRLCLVIHNNPTDRGNIATPDNDVHEPGGSGGVHNVIKFLEDWSDINWAFIGSLVVLDRARYTRGYLGNQDVYNPPKRFYNFNEDLKIELPPFPDVINEVFIW